MAMPPSEWLAIGINSGAVYVSDLPAVSFLEVYNQWFVMKMNCIKPRSLDRIESTFDSYYNNRDICDVPISDFTEKYISDFLSAHIISKGGMPYKSFLKIYQIVNNVHIYAVDLEIGDARVINWNLVKRYLPFGSIESEKPKEYIVSLAERKKLFDAVLQDKIYYNKHSACLCLLLNFYLGLRIGELASLCWKDIDYEFKSVRVFKIETRSFERDADGKRTESMNYRVVEDTKTVYSVRQVPLSDGALYILRLLRAHHNSSGYNSDYLAYDGTDCSLLVSLENTLYRLCKKVGIANINSHNIRKTFATDLHNAGLPTKMIADLIGHTDVSTTEQYYVISSVNTELVLETMNRVLGVGYIRDA